MYVSVVKIWRQIPRIWLQYNKICKDNLNLSMIKSNQKADNEQRKSQVHSDDSIQICVEPHKKQLTKHTDFDIKFEQDERKINMYIELDPKSILNLTKEVNKNRVFDEDERRFYKNCIFIKKIQTPESHCKGNFRVAYMHYKGLTFTIQINPSPSNQKGGLVVNQQTREMFSRAKIHYKTQQGWETKWVNCDEGEQMRNGNYNFEIGASDVQKILKEKLLLVILFEKHPKVSKDHLGIQNEGNTCYANSTLQLLFHFMPLRKMIVERPSNKLGKLTKSLQEIFVDLMTQDSSIRAESLLACFEKIDNLPHRQQDIHQFLISFFDELENQMPEVAQFWTGKDFQVTASKQHKYESKQQQNFTELQLFMADQKGVRFYSISQSLKHLLQEDRADEPIDTDEFGKLEVYKSRFFETMPPLLFMNIKRYEYHVKRKELKKINADMSYPQQINLDFLMKTNQGLNYVLYAVVVHKGRTPNSGHYFCFVNVSKDVDKPDWYEFNDSVVRKANQSKVLSNYTGKQKIQIYLNQQFGKWCERAEPSEETAYLLAYINRDQFESFQSTTAEIPSWQKDRLLQKLTEDQAKTMAAVKLYILQDETQFKPYEIFAELQEVKLVKDEILESEIKRFEKPLGCKVGTIWKVNCKTRTIKHVHKDYGEESRITVGRHTEFKRGIRQPDYFMIVPEQKMKSVDDYQRRKIGILHVQHVTQHQIKESVEILAKQDINERLQEFKKQGMNIEYSQDELQYFVYGWNDYLFVKKS